MTEFCVQVVRIGEMTKHPNADSLSIVQVHGGYPCIVRTEDWKPGDLAVYVPVDALVPTSAPEFAFLGTRGYERIRAKRLRGVFSMGLLVPARPGMKEGQNVQRAMGIEKWEPVSEQEPQHRPTRSKYEIALHKLGTWTSGIGVVGFILSVLGSLSLEYGALLVATCVATFHLGRTILKRTHYKPPVPYYDIDGLRKHQGAIQPGDMVAITEKVHGCNARYVWSKGKFYIGSRTMWDRDGVWAQAAKKYDLKAKLKRRTDMVLFGEVYGPSCQDLHYGIAQGDVGFAAFDVYDLKNKRWLDYMQFRAFCVVHDIPMVPELYVGPWKPELVQMAEGVTSLVGNETGRPNVREGFVVKALHGRTVLKQAGEGYLTRKE